MAALAMLFVVVAACGGQSGSDSPAPTVTRMPVNNQASEPTVSTTLDPNEVTAGQVADLISAAWGGVRSYVSVTQILPLPGASPVASPQVEASGMAVREVIMPDTKRIAITDQGATTEIVLVDGVLSKRVIAVDGTVGAWSTIDPAAIPANDPFAQTYQTMLSPEQPPYAGLSSRQRERIGTQIGEIEIGRRTCQTYRFLQVTDTGEQYQVDISLDSANLPCRIQTTTSANISQTDFTFNKPVLIGTPIA
ncbi:MAG TPA: hypothetical protein PK691_02460 [Thermomicrobiales bacterium]|nr:hypothetical protein [Thermomicrobiales bacterium]HRA47623.1 hypothetical protein [Thermomicrobiales bacterium]